jgi:hypothetical protein
MNIDDNRSCPMCLNGEGAGCMVVVGRGSGGRLRHGLHVVEVRGKMRRIWSSILIEPHFRREINRKPVNKGIGTR